MSVTLIRTTAAALLAVAGITAHAEGLYVGGSLGSPAYRDPIDGVAGPGSSLAGKAYLGYQITPNLAVEGGGFDLGHLSDPSGRVNLKGVYADAVGSYGFAPSWSLFGSGGVAEARLTSDTGGGNDTSPALKLGAGLQYDLSSNVALRGEYERYHFTSAYNARANVGEFSLGLKVGF